MFENEKVNENETSTVVTTAQGSVSEQDPNETVDGVGNADTLNDGNHGHDAHGSSHVDEHHDSEGQGDDERHAGEEQQTFPRSYVEKLRKESAGYRERAGKVDALEQQLHAALVRLDGRLADPADLEFNPEHLEDGDALAAAVTALVERKPGLKAQKFSGDAGAGKRGSGKKPPADLISIIRGM